MSTHKTLMPIQINGKLRDSLVLDPAQSNEDLLKGIMDKSGKCRAALNGKKIKKIVNNYSFINIVT